MTKLNILLIDDEKSQREALAGFLQKQNFNVIVADSGSQGVELFRNDNIDIVITDFKMPDLSGEDVLRHVREINPIVPVIIMTAFGRIDSAVGLMKTGAFDYLQKPLELDELMEIIGRAKERIYIISENEAMRERIDEKLSFDNIVAESREMQQVLNIAARVAPSKASVLIRGESGTGKELIARAIHQSSDRADRPFVVVNCAAMPDTLFESELFGHEKGAFTSADRQRTGKFEEADGGTLFIDEVGDIPLMIQVKLLRAVQFGEIMRLGSNKVIRPDVRIITATNRNLEKMIREGEFREDLYYRFNVVNIDIPPLRSRRLDIPPLIDRFLEKFAGMNKKDVASLSKEARDALMKYDFPGNVRELENIIQRAVVLTREEVITLEDLPDYVKKGNALSGESEIGEISVGDLNEKVEQLERQMIEKALDQTGGNQSKAAELLNISERTLRYKLTKYGK
ncbi:MAG: sigma-54-dependent transcriptional regulator [Candidatus Kapaibacterium sp.]